jgi:hypothetical protein
MVSSSTGSSGFQGAPDLQFSQYIPDKTVSQSQKYPSQ